MEQIKRTLKQRMERLTRPEPAITIYNGHQFYLTDTREMGQRSQVSVQLSVRFRDKQLRQLKGPILGIFWPSHCTSTRRGGPGPRWR